jgi:hypothetical protein
MLGGEREAPPMILAQRDMIKLEKDYYYEKMIDFIFIVVMIVIFTGLGLFTYKIFHGGFQ